MKVIAKLLPEFLGKTGRIQAFFIRHIFRAKVSFYLLSLFLIPDCVEKVLIIK